MLDKFLNIVKDNPNKSILVYILIIFHSIFIIYIVFIQMIMFHLCLFFILFDINHNIIYLYVSITYIFF